MIVYLGTTSKKRNSTEQPTLTKTVNCILKEGTSLINPTLIFDRKAIGHTYNYVYIPDFGRYYFVGDPVYDNARIEYPCRCDVLASFKTEIGASSHYILRCASDSNGYIIDTMYPPSSENSNTTFKEFTAGSYSWALPPQTYCVGIAGLGGVTYYYMSAAYYKGFFDTIFDPTFADDYLNIWGTLNPNLKALIDPIQYITCVWGFPFAYSAATGDSASSVPVGPLSVTVYDANHVALTCKKLSSNLQFFVDVPIGAAATLPSNPCTIPKPDHPQKARGEYMHTSQYTVCSLLTPLGEYQLDASVIAQSTSTRLWVKFYAPTGDLHIQVIAYMGLDLVLDDSIKLLDIVGKAAVSVPVSQIVARGGYSGIFGTMSNIAGISGLASGSIVSTATNAILGGIGQIGSAAEAAIPKATITGSQGSAANNDRGFCVSYQYYLAVDDDNTNHGRPLCEVRQINTLSGYVLCQADEIETTATDSEAAEILNYLNSGFFYE